MSTQRAFYQDRWNPDKTWEVVKLVGGYYLRQYIKGKQFGRGIRTTKNIFRVLGYSILRRRRLCCECRK